MTTNKMAISAIRKFFVSPWGRMATWWCLSSAWPVSPRSVTLTAMASILCEISYWFSPSDCFFFILFFFSLKFTLKNSDSTQYGWQLGWFTHAHTNGANIWHTWFSREGGRVLLSNSTVEAGAGTSTGESKESEEVRSWSVGSRVVDWLLVLLDYYFTLSHCSLAAVRPVRGVRRRELRGAHSPDRSSRGHSPGSFRGRRTSR